MDNLLDLYEYDKEQFDIEQGRREEELAREEEWTNCPVHGTLHEYFTDCPDCIQEENDRDYYYMYLEEDAQVQS